MDKKIAKTDITYCINKECTNKCWRHEDNFEFDNNKNYSWMEKCEV